jgi:membrane-bound serine protease (ClpP class)
MIKKFISAFTLLLSAIIFTVFADPEAAGANAGIRRAFIVPVSGVVDHSMSAFIGRSLTEGCVDNTLIVLEIDTFGGQLDAALTIVDSIISCAVPTVAFVRSKAISAGALIAFAADRIVMRSNTTIGDVAPIINTGDGPKMLGEKHQSPIRAKFRALAKRNGYPEILSEAMVTEEVAVFEVTLPDSVMYLDSVRIADLDPQIRAQIVSTRTVVKAGELLTMTDTEALRYGFSSMSVGSIDEMLREMGLGGVEVISVGKNWSENLVSIIAMLAPVLMMIGFSALYIEIRSPGFGIPGIIGIICLAVVFFGQYMVGLANYTELLLLTIGAVLLAVEIFVTPGFGVIGFTGIAFMMVGMVLSFQNFVIPSPELPWQADILRKNIQRVALSVIGSVVLIVIFFKYFFERLARVIKGPYLAATLADAQSDEGMEFVPAVGDKGIASTTLRPAGKVRIGTNNCDVITDGQFIDAGTEVTVIQVQGNRIVVA